MAVISCVEVRTVVVAPHLGRGRRSRSRNKRRNSRIRSVSLYEQLQELDIMQCALVDREVLIVTLVYLVRSLRDKVPGE